MTIRRIINLPPNTNPAELHAFNELWKALDSDTQRHDLITNYGATVTVVPREKPAPAIVRRARARAR